MDSQAEPETVGGAAVRREGQALAIHLKCKNVTVDFDPEHPWERPARFGVVNTS